MFLIDKHRTEKHKFIAFSILVGLGICLPAKAQSENINVTPLQLRVIQTRKFSKPIDEVVNAIKTAGEDAGYSCTVYITPTIGPDQKFKRDQGGGVCYLNPKRSDSTNQGLATAAAVSIPFFGSFIGSAIVSETASKATYEYNEKLYSIKYELNVDKTEGGTLLRMRAYNVKHDQIINSDVYAKQFKMYGDSLFIQTVEINPAEQE